MPGFISHGLCDSAFLGRLEHSTNDHRVRIQMTVGEHRPLPLPQ